jgi:CheY-like chemotaxis protein/anti-sigma regulatory factor (Ser/Thr protein kinase)
MDRMRRFGRKTAGDRHSVAPAAIARSARSLMDKIAPEGGITIEVDVDDSLRVLADEMEIEQVLVNLIQNAADAIHEQASAGRIRIRASDDASDAAMLGLHVEDSGPGFPPAVLHHALDAFFTTKPEGKGTGLGLAQAFGFTKQTGGHIKIYSEVGHGTTIKLYLPRTRRVADSTDDNRSLPVEGGSETILVVEDDEGVRAAVVDMLNELGYRVLKADQAESALEILKTEKPDLIFTDVVMPGAIHTRDFTARAQDMHPGIRVLYTSGYTQNAIVHNGKLDDDALLLSKPYRKDELARKLRNVFAGTATGPIRPPKSAPGASLEGKRGKVLVVEDVALIRMTTVDMVEQIGFDAAEASDAGEALAILQKDQSFDILLTDLGLPGMNGRQLVEEVLRLRPGMKIIIASGYSTDEELGSKLPPNVSYLTKPFDMQQLRRVLEA